MLLLSALRAQADGGPSAEEAAMLVRIGGLPAGGTAALSMWLVLLNDGRTSLSGGTGLFASSVLALLVSAASEALRAADDDALITALRAVQQWLRRAGPSVRQQKAGAEAVTTSLTGGGDPHIAVVLPLVAQLWEREGTPSVQHAARRYNARLPSHSHSPRCN